MAVYFFDTSGIVKRYIQETGSVWVQNTCDPISANTLYLARIAVIEVTSAIARRQRAGHLTTTRSAVVLSQFRQDFVQDYRILEVTPALIADAARLAEFHALRANDALQLAAFVELQAQWTANNLGPVTLVSADQELNAGAQSLGLLVEDPNLHP